MDVQSARAECVSAASECVATPTTTDPLPAEPKVQDGFLVTPRPDQNDVVLQVYHQGQEIAYAEVTRKEAFALARAIQRGAVLVENVRRGGQAGG